MNGWPCRVCGVLTPGRNLCPQHDHGCAETECNRTVYTADTKCGFHRTGGAR